MDVRSRLNWLDRAELEEILVAACIQCYSTESDEDLRDAIYCNISDGTLDAEILDQYIGQRPTDP